MCKSVQQLVPNQNNAQNLQCYFQGQLYICEETKRKTQLSVGSMRACNVSDINIQFTMAVANHINSTWDLLLKALRVRVLFFLNVLTLMSKQVNNVKSIHTVWMPCN